MSTRTQLSAISLLMLACTFFSSVHPAYADDFFPYPIQSTQLGNGLQVISVPFDSPGTVAFYIVVRVGSRDELEQGKTGFAHFFEHMMFRGTTRFSPDQYTTIMQSCAGTFNASTSRDTTVFYTVANSACLEKLFDLESDRFRNLQYSEQVFKTEAQAVLGEYTKNFANPYMQLEEKTLSLAFKHHPYRHSVMGFLEDIKNMPNQYAYSRQFFERFYRPNNISLLVVGDVNPAQNLKLAKKYFGDWQRTGFRSLIPSDARQVRELRDHIAFRGKNTIFKMVFKGPAYSDANLDYVALSILLELEFSDISPLHRKLVMDEKKVKHLFYGSPPTRDPFLITMGAELFDEKDMNSVQTAIEESLTKIRTQLITQADLDRVKSAFKYGRLNSLTTPLKLASTLGNYLALTGDPSSFKKMMLNIEKLKPEDLRQIAQKYLLSSTRTIVTLSPAKENMP